MKTKHIALLVIATLLLSSVASAGFFGDLWNKVTGKATVEPVPTRVASRVAAVNPIGPEAPKAQKLTAKGLLQQAENQVKLLTNAPMFKNDRNAQAALKKIKADLDQLKVITASERPAPKPTTGGLTSGTRTAATPTVAATTTTRTATTTVSSTGTRLASPVRTS